MRVELRIRRWDPSAPQTERVDHFTLHMPAGDSVLSALVRVYEEHDPTLAFRYACGMMKCGECGVVVNGTPCLACERLLEPDVLVEPLPGLPLLRDLAVDRNAVLARLREQVGEEDAADETPDTAPGDLQAAQRVEDHIRVTECCECLLCMAVCPVWHKRPDEFPGPLGLLWLAQGSAVTGAAELCTGCGRCQAVCPAGAVGSRPTDQSEPQPVG